MTKLQVTDHMGKIHEFNHCFPKVGANGVLCVYEDLVVAFDPDGEPVAEFAGNWCFDFTRKEVPDDPRDRNTYV